jgi:hypothetical protein
MIDDHPAMRRTVMAGFVPAIHDFGRTKEVDGRHKAGHDE